MKELFEHERYLASISSAYLPEGVFQLLDRIEAAVTKRINELEKSIEGYERILDKAYDDFQACVDNHEVREVLKELIEYAPRKNKEEK